MKMIIDFWNWVIGKKDPHVEITISSEDLGGGKFRVNGVTFYADNHLEAITKYKRGAKSEPQSETKNI